MGGNSTTDLRAVDQTCVLSKYPRKGGAFEPNELPLYPLTAYPGVRLHPWICMPVYCPLEL